MSQLTLIFNKIPSHLSSIYDIYDRDEEFGSVSLIRKERADFIANSNKIKGD